MSNLNTKIIILFLFFAFLAFGGLTKPKTVSAACLINSAIFSPSGEQADSWYNENKRPEVKIIIKTTGCVGEVIEMSITERDSLTGITNDDIDNKIFTAPSDNFTINLLAGETECEQNITANCEYYISFRGAEDFDTQNKPRGELKYECRGLCRDSWVWLGITPEGVTLPGAGPVVKTDTTYTPLAPLPGLDKFDTSSACAFGKYLDIMISIFIGIAAVLAMVMIVLGGIEYMTSELISSKEHGKERITNAILGLIIALGSYALLNTINPKLLEKCLNLPKATIIQDLGAESSAPFIPISAPSLQALGINCPGSGGTNSLTSISQTFIGKSTYSMEKRNTFGSSTVYLDCSSFVAQTYSCAGLPSPGSNTAEMFSGVGVDSVTNMTATKINGVELKVGDLLGWRQGGSEKYGHVVMYIGNGQVIDSRGGTSFNQAIKISSVTAWGDRIKYIKRGP